LNKRNLTIVTIVFVAVITVFSMKILTGKGYGQNKGANLLGLKDQYKRVINSSKPSIIVFSYDADCCETTKKFFNEYNAKAKRLTKDYESRFETLFINTGIIKEGQEEEILKSIAKENGVKNLPSLLILDEKDKRVKVIEGDFDDKEVRMLLEEVTKK
jgi:hypothetical protein